MKNKRGATNQSDRLDGEAAANASLTRREFFKGAGLTGLTAAVYVFVRAGRITDLPANAYDHELGHFG
jgi:hypothetical protein